MIFLLWLMWGFNLSMVAANVTSSPPVLIWGIQTPETKTIFQPVTSKQFSKLMKRIQKRHMIVVYFASELSARDINCAPCFPYLKEIQPMNYYSQVVEPLVAFQETNAIIWHKPTITDKRRLEVEMKLPCQPGQLHGFSFNDRNFQAHDNAMEVSYYQFRDCPVVHIYTAFTEENRAFLRRKTHYRLMTSYKSSEPVNQQDQQNQSSADNQKDWSSHLAFYNTTNTTILRHETAVFGFRRIVMATRDSSGSLASTTRSPVKLVRGNKTMQVGFYNDIDSKAGMILVLDTVICPLVIELLPVKENWHLTRILCANRTYYPRDLIFFSSQFSLCCSDMTLYSSDRTRLSLFGIHLDIITSKSENGMEKNYEAKPCWSCSHFMSPALTQSLVVMILFFVILWAGLSFITSIGRNRFVQVAIEPDLYIKADL